MPVLEITSWTVRAVPTQNTFELECRAATAPAAEDLGEQAKDALIGPRLTHVLAEYFDPDDTGQKQGGYFSYIVSIGLSYV